MSRLGFLDMFRRSKGPTESLHPGRTTEAVSSAWGAALSPYRSRTANVLESLRKIDDEADAVVFLGKHNPDVSMAIWNVIRLANQGNEMAFYGMNARNKGRRVPALEDDWRDFASRVNALSNAGLDGLLNQLHYSAFVLGAQGLEAEVASALDDIVDVYPIDPRTICWKYDKNKQVWVPYQVQAMKEVSLLDANFFWVPTDPDIDDPRGTLPMGSTLQAIDFQMQVLQDLQAVIHNQGWQRYDIKVLLDRVISAMPPQVRMNPEKAKEWLQSKRAEVEKALKNLKPDDSFIHFDDTEFGPMQGGSATRSMDFRALFDGIDAQLMSGTKQQGVFLNRVSGTTETWSTVQFRIFVSGLANIQRGSKRLMEDVARLWLRTKGIQAVPKFTHNTIDWQAEEDKANVALLKQQFWAISQLMGWVDKDKAASEATGYERAAGEPSEAIRVAFSVGGGGNGNGHGQGAGISGVARNAERNAEEEGPILRILGGRSAKGGD